MNNTSEQAKMLKDRDFGLTKPIKSTLGKIWLFYAQDNQPTFDGFGFLCNRIANWLNIKTVGQRPHAS